MNANLLKSIYFRLKSPQLRYRAIQAMKLTGMRSLVVRQDTNHICNLRCKMCYFSNPKRDRSPAIKPSDYEQMAKNILPKARILYLSCYAEPLCTPNIEEFVKIARAYRVPFISMTSNCMLLSDKIIAGFIEHKLDELIVSITGGTKGTYEENHAGASWEKLWGNLKSLKEAKQKAGSKKPEIKFNYILTKKSINEVQTFIETVDFMKPDFITLRELIPFEDMDENFYRENRLMPEDIARIPSVKQTFTNAGITVVDSLQCTNKNKPGTESIPEKYPCLQPFFQVYVRPNGDVRFCLFRDVAGNLKESSIDTIIKAPQSRAFFKSLKKKSTCTCIKNCPNFTDYSFEKAGL
jgi:MoaA/NifB/PqqE/SkfB family radical SAM enzyme